MIQYMWFGNQETVNQVHEHDSLYLVLYQENIALVHVYDSIYLVWISRNHQSSLRLWLNIFGLLNHQPSPLVWLNILGWISRSRQPSPCIWLIIFGLDIKKQSNESRCMTQYIWFRNQETINQFPMHDSIFLVGISKNRQLSPRVWLTYLVWISRIANRVYMFD